MGQSLLCAIIRNTCMNAIVFKCLGNLEIAILVVLIMELDDDTDGESLK